MKVYYCEKSYYKRGGPAYLYIGGEGKVNPWRLQAGYWQDHGKTKNAMLFVVEHRFYGYSQPMK